MALPDDPTELVLLLVEDDPSLRRDVEEMLRRKEPNVRVLSAGSGREALALCERHAPTVTLLDLGLPDMTGVELMGHLQKRAPQCVSVAFTVFDDAPTILAALRAGARGYLLKSTPSDRVMPTLREAMAGGLPLSPSVARLVVDELLSGAAQPAGHALTERETELLRLLAQGKTYAQSAQALGIAIGTVQGYVKNIYGKLQVASKAEATLAAVRLGLVK